MSNTTGNDVNFLQATDLSKVGAGAGNDRYVLDMGLMAANQSIEISDTKGSNILQLMGGLEIVSAQVFADAMLITLNNGAKVTVLGASTFTFLTGGNNAGLGGLSQTYAEFVTTSLGLASVPTGTATATSGALTVNTAGGTTGGGVIVPGATYALTAGAASADEGTTATFELATTGLAAGTAVAYTLSGIDAADLASGALTGTAIVDASGKATISVALAADAVTEGPETLTVTAGGVSASTIVNDTSVTPVYGLTASAASVDEGSSVTFTLALGKPNFTYSYELTGVDATDVVGGVLTGSITTDANGNGTFTVTLANDRATDGADTLVATLPNTGLSASVTVNDTSLDNVAPVAEAATGATTEAGAIVAGQLVATDAENDAITFALDADVEGLTLNADGTYSFDPSLNTDAQALTYKDAPLDVVANYTVTDALGATDTGTITITVTPKPLTFELVPVAAATYVEEGQTIEYVLRASEAVQEAITAEVRVIPGDGTAGQTAANDFGSGALNPQIVTIAVGDADSNAFNLIPQNDAATELPESYTVKTTITSGATFTVADVVGEVRDPSTIGGVGQTFTLTTGIDTVPGLIGSAGSTGTDGDDTFVALIDGVTAANSTLNALDSVNGGLGNNSMTLNMVGAAAALPGGIAISNVQTINARGSAAVTLDLTAAAGITGVTALNSTLSTTATLAAAATTDVNVSGATGAIDVAGGKNVVVSDATADQAINVGESGAGSTNAAGTITVTDTKQGTADITVDGGTTVGVTATIDATTTAVAGGDILIGGTTKATGAVTVVQNLNSNGGDNEADDLTAAAITVSGGSTVDITVNATSNAKDETSDGDIGIGAVTVNGDGKTTTVTVNQNASTTTFTKAGSALVKESSVVTFGAVKSGETLIINGLTFTAAADLTAEQAAAAFANLTAADSQSEGGVVTNGEYTGAFNTAVWTSGAATGNVVTFTAQDEDEADLAFTGTATTNDAGARIPTQVKTAGALAVGADTSANIVAYGTVTIDDEATAAIKTITVNGYATGSVITDSDALETLNLSKAAGTVAMTVADTADTLALTLSAMGSSASDAVLTFTAAPLTLNVTSTGSNYVNLTAAATKELNVSGTGLLDIDATDLAALETVKVTGSAGLSLNPGVANTVTSVDTTGTTGTVTATIDADIATYAGGAGVDNVTLSTTTVDKSVNLGDGNDTLTLAAGTTALTSEMIGGDGTDTLAMASADAETASATTTFETKITGFERLALGQVAAAATDTIDLANLDDINHVTTAGGAATAVALNLDNMAVGGTLQYTGALLNALGVTDVDFVDASGSADSFNVVLNVSGAALDFQDLDISGIETLNLTATDSVTTTIESATINVLDTSLKSVAITGNAAVVFSANSTVLTLVDGSAMTAGGLTATTNGTVAQTIKGGAGVDNLTASFAQDVLEGGAGADTLTVADGANLVSLNGGAGKDTYVIGLATNSSGYASIAGTAAELSGDVIQFGAGIADFAAAKIVLAGTAVFQDYANEATKSALADNNVSWFQFQGDTYVVQNNSMSTSFDNGVDAIVKIVGLVNFTYNVAGTLEIA